MLQATAMQGPELRDIHVPAPPSWWPPAPGWWLLTVLVVALCIFLFLHLYRNYRRRQRRLAVMAEFERTVAASRGDAPALAASLSAFLRRLAMRASPGAAALKGEAWLGHLDAEMAGEEFSHGVGRALIEAPYRAQASFDEPALIALARRAAEKFSANEVSR
ncbi:MAG: DUF4381 family protein [Rudaea sp.]|uniref:DUF4381 family protein n=1 Tax=unclassified Rudaea TaxID=2627037 RepID=UPI0014854931|nr:MULTISPECIES: DUF4381 family protein [unclassified Rudaea]MBN8885986.1 DUF4381 family protein [Rudaea sp.]MBR0347782.1 DUF4381 family protein [Rudaea sp.]